MRTRKSFGPALALVLSVLIGIVPISGAALLPSQLFMYESEKVSYDLTYPFDMKDAGGESISVSTTQYSPGDKKITIESRSTGNQEIEVRMFGALTVKTISVNVVSEKYLIPGGKAVGIAMRSSGALVVGMEEIESGEKRVCPAKEAGLAEGDVIVKVNDTEIESADQMIELINASDGKKIRVTYIRGGTRYLTMVQPAYDTQTKAYRFGIWVKDSSVGIGTMTYYDPATGMYASLGHPICDTGTGTVVSVKNGELLNCGIIDVVKGKIGQPGELKGVLNSFLPSIGTILLNCEYGLYGESYTPLTSSVYPNGLPVGSRHSVRKGPCTIITTIDAGGEKEYAAEIISCAEQNKQSTKSMVIKITDERLLETTGGIVQGMSGSPVIQNGHIVGAITHVFVNDPTEGYAIYLDWMLPQTGSVK